MFLSKIYPFPSKIKVKNFINVVMLLNLSYTFHFLYSSLLFFRWLASFWWFFFSLLRTTLYNTWKNHYRQLQLLIMIFNKKPLVNIASISSSRKLSWNQLSFCKEYLLITKWLKNSVRNCLSFVWFRITGKTIKTSGVHKKTHLFNLSSLDGILRTLSNI